MYECELKKGAGGQNPRFVVYVPRQEATEETPRVIAFIEQLDKRLTAAGYTHQQRLEITGILMSNKVVAAPPQAEAQSKEK